MLKPLLVASAVLLPATLIRGVEIVSFVVGSSTEARVPYFAPIEGEEDYNPVDQDQSSSDEPGGASAASGNVIFRRGHFYESGASAGTSAGVNFFSTALNVNGTHFNPERWQGGYSYSHANGGFNVAVTIEPERVVHLIWAFKTSAFSSSTVVSLSHGGESFSDTARSGYHALQIPQGISNVNYGASASLENSSDYTTESSIYSDFLTGSVFVGIDSPPGQIPASAVRQVLGGLDNGSPNPDVPTAPDPLYFPVGTLQIGTDDSLFTQVDLDNAPIAAGTPIEYSVEEGDPLFSTIHFHGALNSFPAYDLVFAGATVTVQLGGSVDFTSYVPAGIQTFTLIPRNAAQLVRLAAESSEVALGPAFTFTEAGTVSITAVVVPEPASCVLGIAAALMLGVWGRASV